MKALTIIQPYAELIASGAKRVENRTWFMKHRGPLAIHAGKAARYGGESVSAIALEYDVDPAALVFGAVIAVADVIDCVSLVRNLKWPDGGRSLLTPDWAKAKHPWLDEHEHREGPCCIVLANIRRLARPLMMNGQQGIFDVDDAAIRAAQPAGDEGAKEKLTIP